MKQALKVVVVEDEDDLREDVIFGLAEFDLEVVGARDGVELERVLAHGCPDVVVLDVGLPGDDGYAIAARLRADPTTAAVGIVFLTAMGQLADKVKGLSGGADAYLVKPVDFAELGARIVSVARRVALAAPGRWVYGTGGDELVSPFGKAVRLTPTEIKILGTLVSQAGRPVSRRDLIQGLGESPASYDERRLEAAVSRLRKKIETKCSCASPVQAVHGVGYAFTAPVKGTDA